VEGEAAVIGKAIGKDARKATLVSALGLPAAKQRLALLEEEAVELLASFGAEAGTLRETVRFVVGRRA
jgi:farnesyl diphosphate synthase